MSQANEIQKDNCAKIRTDTEADVQSYKDFEKRIEKEKADSKQKLANLTELRNYYVKRIEANNKYLKAHKQEPVVFTPPPKQGKKKAGMAQLPSPEALPQ